MKRLKKLVSTLAAVALCALLPGVNVLTVSAAEPVTFYVKYVDADEGWCFQTGGWSETEYNRDLYYMHEEIKDGDILVIDSNESGESIELTINKKLSNLTITQGSKAVVATNGVDVVYALADSASAITGNVNEAYLYDTAGVTFHSNVNTLTMYDTRAESTGVATVAGTAGHVVRQTDSGYVYFEIYNVAKGKLLIDWGGLKTDPADYSTTPAAAQAPAPQAPAAPAPQQSASSGEYDDVPKTGESNAVIWLVGIAALCLVGKRALKHN